MINKKGSAVIIIVIAILVFGTIMSYIFARTSNSQINQLLHIKEIKETYQIDASASEIISDIYQAFINQIPSDSE